MRDKLVVTLRTGKEVVFEQDGWEYQRSEEFLLVWQRLDADKRRALATFPPGGWIALERRVG